MEKQIFHFPKWVIPNWVIGLYAVAVIVLAPWIYILAEDLPERQLAHHWDLAWAGFDVLMLCLFALTAFLAIRKTIWFTLSAISLSTILFIDAWFDILTSKSGKQQWVALLLAILVELPIDVLTLFLAYRAINHLHESAKHPDR